MPETILTLLREIGKREEKAYTNVDFDLSDFIGPATLPPAILFILYLVRQHWQDIKAAGHQVYTDRKEDTRDRREASQRLTAEQVRYEQQRASWKEDKLAELLEMDASFIRDTIFEELKALRPIISEIKNQRETIRQLAMVISDLRDQIKRE